MENLNNITFRLSSITNEDSSPIPEDIASLDITEKSLQFQYRIETIIKMAENVITIIPQIRYLHLNTKLYEASVEINFSISSLSALIDIDPDNRTLEMKVDILPTLLGIAYSTLRGIVYTRTLSSPLESFPIPAIDIKVLAEKNGISVKE